MKKKLGFKAHQPKPVETGRPPDYSPNGQMRALGWTRMGLDTHVELFQRRFNAKELRELASWCNTVADWIDSKLPVDLSKGGEQDNTASAQSVEQSQT